MKTDIWTQERIIALAAKHFTKEVTAFEDAMNSLVIFSAIGEAMVVKDLSAKDGNAIGAAAITVIMLATRFDTKIKFSPEGSYSPTARTAFAAAVDCFARVPTYALYLDDKERPFNGTIRIVAQRNFNQILSHLAKFCDHLGVSLQQHIDNVMNDVELDQGAR